MDRFLTGDAIVPSRCRLNSSGSQIRTASATNFGFLQEIHDNVPEISRERQELEMDDTVAIPSRIVHAFCFNFHADVLNVGQVFFRSVQTK
jgi:hypothetical protein